MLFAGQIVESFDLLVAGILVLTVWKVYTDIHNKKFNTDVEQNKTTSP